MIRILQGAIIGPAIVRGASCIALSLALGACNDGSSSGAVQSGATGALGNVPTSGVQTPEAFFARSIQPALENCRLCHVPGGPADVADGDALQLHATNTSEDYARLFAAWQSLDKGVLNNRLLTMPSDSALRHSGSTPWPTSSSSFLAMKTLLACWDDPANCALNNVTPEQLAPLLGSKRGRHIWASYCEGETASSTKLLPPDPRTLIQAGRAEVSGDRAVHFNGWWEDCHAADELENERQATTCGEYISRRQRGLEFLTNELAVGSLSVSDFRNSWETWGLSERPDNFDQLYTLRYGLNFSVFPNPYPLEGEDPNNCATTENPDCDGGSGRLPMGLRLLKDSGGNWTNNIGTAACFTCHGGQVGDPLAGDPQLIGFENFGLGNNNYDVIMAAHDGSPFKEVPIVGGAIPPADPNALFNVGIKQRGQNNAVGAFEFLNTILDLDSLGINPNPLKNMKGIGGAQDVSHPLAHTQDTPAWWNMGSRPRKFFDAGVSNDSTRIIMAAGPGEFGELFSFSGEYYRNRIEEWDQDLEAFFLSLVSPVYPEEIDAALAEQGAVLFHNKDLWNEEGNADRPRPEGGNGSCASCHGAYSPRYVNDQAFLADPVLEGVASHIVTLDVIGTDTARSDMLTTTLRRGWDTTYWAYPEADPGYVAPEDKDPVTESLDDMLPDEERLNGACGWQKEIIGYQAPPLYGVWATAPYLHNGSVPNLAALLDSSKRSQIWQREIQTEVFEQGSVEIKGFDQRLSAFDFENVGWKSRALSCSEIPGSDQLNCSPSDDEGPSMQQLVQNYLNSAISWAGLITIADPAPEGIDKRLVYDTRILGNDDAGHEFSDVLTDAERKAIIEYLKTL
ncbi:MAG: hypothetical protein CMN85_13480 [Spongiibacteraceae bacterium]|nr:hypothetical protein [Spongiibacteraceae bacterium]